MMVDEYYMQQALDLARRGIGRTNPNPAVGCLIMNHSKIVGQGWHKKCGGPHAEIIALAQAQGKAIGATMYVTLEPCSHQGRTPPCVDQVIASGIKRVVIAMRDPNPCVRGRSIKKMQWAGITVEVGCLEAQARNLNRAFCRWITTGMPLVTVKTAQTLDGKIATRNGSSQWISSAEARKFTHQQRNDFDAILVGINTVLKDNPALNPTVKSKPWTKIVVDTRLRIPLTARLFTGHRTIVATTSSASKRKIQALEQKGVEVIVCPVKNKQVSLKFLMRQLGAREITNLLIEGGAGVVGSALKERIAERMVTVVALKIFGDQQARSSIDGLNILNVAKAVTIDVDQVRQVGKDWVFEGKICYGNTEKRR